jgi:predicted dehydrogenase
MIGYSDGNGHPFSFSAIVNGYDAARFARADWPVIADYLSQPSIDEFGVGRFRVTHAWTQDPERTRQLCEACAIEVAVDDVTELIGAVDAVVIARDDHESHASLALPLLEAGLPVFVDKPLALRDDDLRILAPHLDGGQLMSCSAMRYAPMVTDLAARLNGLGKIRAVQAVNVMSWPKYSIHVLEAAFTLLEAHPVSVTPVPSDHHACMISCDDGTVVAVNSTGPGPVVFRLGVYGELGAEMIDVTDNFAMFRATLQVFHEQVETGQPMIDGAHTLELMHVLRAGDIALREDRRVDLDEVRI